MMVPRAFLFTSVPPPKAAQPCAVKDQDTMATLKRPGLHSSRGFGGYGSRDTTPVVIPPKRGSRTPVRQEARSRTPSKTSSSSRRSSSSSSHGRSVPTAVSSMLDATAIPVPRRTWSTRRPRKLPRGNHVAEFSRLMQQGLKSKEENIFSGTGNSPLDILLSPPESHDKYSTSNESEGETSFSTRATSSESVPSLEPDFGSPSSSPFPSTPGSQRSPSERRQLRYSHTEDCAFDHPLLEAEDECELVQFGTYSQSKARYVSPKKRSESAGSFPRLKSSFKSNLTASLRAIKSAAQSVSTFATPSVQPEDFLTRSLFTITPELTDDRRPPPMRDPPSPALRRYLNPTPVSPAEMCVYHDHPHDPTESSQACAVSIQMQTYRRSRGRGHKRNHFHVVSQGRDKLSTFDPEVPPMSRQREPRENSDFLRMVVLEMNMRRCGKLREDIPTRARIWLPARKSNPYRLTGDYEDGDDNDTIPSRWVGVSA